MRVLVIEDNDDFSQLIAEILKIKGYIPCVARDADTALALARQNKPDLILCDIQLRGKKNGLDFARSLRADPVLGKTPLVAITGNAETVSERAMREGFDMVLPKPVKFAALTEVLTALAPRNSAAPRTRTESDE